MNPRDHWLHGAHITLRQVWFGKVWAAFPVTIVEDSPSQIVVYISPGAIFMAPICRREDYLRELASTDWQLCEYTWRDEPMLWSTVPGEGLFAMDHVARIDIVRDLVAIAFDVDLLTCLYISKAGLFATEIHHWV